MNAEEMTTHIHDAEVLAAIRSVETRSSGEVRVFITNRSIAEPLKEARAAFTRLRMDQTARRNAALVFLAPRSRQFALVGDEGLHQYCGEAFWNSCAEDLAAGFHAGDYTGALIRVIERIGAVLARHFPPQENDHQELPDDVVRE